MPVEEVAFVVGASVQDQAKGQDPGAVTQGKVNPCVALCSEEEILGTASAEWARYMMCGHGWSLPAKVSYQLGLS